jgi:hypothetical protein
VLDAHDAPVDPFARVEQVQARRPPDAREHLARARALGGGVTAAAHDGGGGEAGEQDERELADRETVGN